MLRKPCRLQTDGRTDGRTDKVNPVYPPPPTLLGGGIMKYKYMLMFPKIISQLYHTPEITLLHVYKHQIFFFLCVNFLTATHIWMMYSYGISCMHSFVQSQQSPKRSAGSTGAHHYGWVTNSNRSKQLVKMDWFLMTYWQHLNLSIVSATLSFSQQLDPNKLAFTQSDSS